MIIKEIQILSEGLWESAKTNLEFFSSVQTFIKRMAELDFSSANSVKEANLYIQKIEEFFKIYRSAPGASYIYFEPPLISTNNNSVIKIQNLINKLNIMSVKELEEEFESVMIKKKIKSNGGGKIFIGHGRSKLWARVQIYLKEDLNLKTIIFEDESRTGETIINILDDFLNNSSFAILIMTAEDETAEGTSRARQNVIHEAGLFQGRLGFDKVIILKQDGVEEFSNVAGFQYIPFCGDNIEQSFYEIQRKFKKLGLI
jgi:predicted nucleotide-binding protein